MKQVYKYDLEGNYIEPVLIDDGQEIPFNCTNQPLPQPNWKPLFKNGEWFETVTEEEKKPPVTPPQESVEDKLVQMEQDVADLWYSVMRGRLV